MLRVVGKKKKKKKHSREFAGKFAPLYIPIIEERNKTRFSNGRKVLTGIGRCRVSLWARSRSETNPAPCQPDEWFQDDGLRSIYARV